MAWAAEVLNHRRSPPIDIVEEGNDDVGDGTDAGVREDVGDVCLRSVIITLN